MARRLPYRLTVQASSPEKKPSALEMDLI